MTVSHIPCAEIDGILMPVSAMFGINRYPTEIMG